ncbi:MAG TPA: DUF2059 domain-containing protein [Nostocaceae cyanobacterium]|nr:DUF2059 domain-containing protein [Nostocaceae cyanobacterium]
MKIKLLIAALAISSTTLINGVALAQNREPIKPVPAAEIDAKKRENIKKLVEIIGSTEYLQQVLSESIDKAKKENPEIPKKFWEMFAQEIKIDDFANELIPLYAKYYTNEEVEQLLAFYNTPLGKKTIQTLPQITQEAEEIGTKIGRQAAERVIKRLETEGYLPSSSR